MIGNLANNMVTNALITINEITYPINYIKYTISIGYILYDWCFYE
jgi:hypothetical protein